MPVGDARGAAAKRDQSSVSAVTRSFLAVWRWLDESPLRQVWPFTVGVLIALAAVRIAGRALWAAGIVVVIYIAIYRLASKATAHDQALRKTLD
jgi:hypothetical protein